jgi:hypothetical protein
MDAEPSSGVTPAAESACAIVAGDGDGAVAEDDVDMALAVLLTVQRWRTVVGAPVVTGAGGFGFMGVLGGGAQAATDRPPTATASRMPWRRRLP